MSAAGNSSMPGHDSGSTAPSGELPEDLPRLLGPYRVAAPIGEGGMGRVYRATQETPVRRDVAIKVVKAGMDSGEILARFEAERQALAMMDHPGVATVFDGGSTPSGRPYFVMEYVRGVPITAYADGRRMATRERLLLFIAVCEAVQHAHQKAVIHRDLKPSNILVTEQDGRPVPKVIDFGVAKALIGSLTDRTLYTAHDVILGTPEYMSPEQADPGTNDIDTRTDVYSLGVILYELLVGQRPFDSKRDGAATSEALRGMIVEREPARPSARLSSAGAAATEAADCRSTDPDTLRRGIEGDLDCIVMTALEKDRNRRYASASDLARDIERHLRNEPVTARPPSRSYRLRKFVRRNRVGVSAAAIVALTLLLGAAGTTAGFVRARRSERNALQEAQTARSVSRFLIDLFRSSDPKNPGGAALTVKEVVDRSAETLGHELTDQPVVHARLISAIGSVYGNMGLYEQARGLLEPALEQQRELLGPDHVDVAETEQSLAFVLGESGDGDRLLQRDLMEHSIAVLERERGPLDRDLARTLNNLGNVFRALDRPDEARDAHLRAIEIYRQLGDPRVASAMNDYALLVRAQGDPDGARRLNEQALTELERMGALDSWQAALNRSSIAEYFERDGQYDEALEQRQQALAIFEATFGTHHYFTSVSSSNLANDLAHLGRLDEARALHERALALIKEVFGDRGIYVDWQLGRLANLLLYQMHEYEAAVPVLEELLAVQDSKPETPPAQIAATLDGLSNANSRLGRYREAERFQRRLIDVVRDQLGDDSDRVQQAEYNMACVEAKLGKPDEALLHLRRVLDAGFANAALWSDGDLESLHGNPEFEELVATVKQRLAAKESGS